MSYHQMAAPYIHERRCHFCGEPGAIPSIWANGEQLYICPNRQNCLDRMADTVLERQGLTKVVEEDGYAD